MFSIQEKHKASKAHIIKIHLLCRPITRKKIFREFTTRLQFNVSDSLFFTVIGLRFCEIYTTRNSSWKCQKSTIQRASLYSLLIMVAIRERWCWLLTAHAGCHLRTLHMLRKEPGHWSLQRSLALCKSVNKIGFVPVVYWGLRGEDGAGRERQSRQLPGRGSNAA